MADEASRILTPTRRQALVAGGAGLGALVAGPSFTRAAECLLTSRQIDGPYHIPEAEARRDVRAGKEGVDLALRLKIVDTDGCEAIAGASAEIWSCDASGRYSGHLDMDPNQPPRLGGGRPSGSRSAGGRGRRREPTDASRFLRGAQVSDEAGEVEFLTIYPGWYAPRAVHVHVKLRLGESELLTTQLYFPDDLTDAVHQTDAYAERYPTPYTNAKDQVKHWGLGPDVEPEGVFPTMTREGAAHVGTLTIGVRRS